MGHAVYGLKDELAIFLWNQGPQMASRDLKKKTDPFTSQAQKWREGDLLAWNILEKDI
jgi:hypothetical protein